MTKVQDHGVDLQKARRTGVSRKTGSGNLRSIPGGGEVANWPKRGTVAVTI